MPSTPARNQTGEESPARVDSAGESYTLFTPGPVMTDAATRHEGGKQQVYHRTPEFSREILKGEALLKQACEAPTAARVMLLTGSGTAGMEATVLNLFSPGETLLVVNSGDFGRRFAEIGELHGHPVKQIHVPLGIQITAAHLTPAAAIGCAGLLVNHHETSTGNLHDLELVGQFCREHGLLFIVDAISSFLADPLSMMAFGIDALILSSQKALALPPGMSFVVLSARAQERVRGTPRRSYYFDFKSHLADIERGQTPFTPAVGILRQLVRRLDALLEHGVERHIATVRERALDFRARIQDLPLRCFAQHPSNAVTALEPLGGVAPADYVGPLMNDHGLFVCPNGGPLGGRIFRVGHLGDLTLSDNARLATAMRALAFRSSTPR